MLLPPQVNSTSVATSMQPSSVTLVASCFQGVYRCRPPSKTWSRPDGGRRGRRGEERGRKTGGGERRERRLLVERKSIFNLLHAVDPLPHPVPGPVLLQHHSLTLIWISPGNSSPEVIINEDDPHRARTDPEGHATYRPGSRIDR